jgi:uncharacterized protein (TIGR02600 family)
MFRPTTARSTARAFALLLVLSTLSLVAALTIAILSLATAERRGAASSAELTAVHSLVETAQNLAISQIRSATQGAASGAPAIWASQPGLIRTFSSSGQPTSVYKLYSDGDMVEPATSFSPQPPPASWAEPPYSELYTDLNRPSVQPASGQLSYPVLDPPPADPSDPAFVEGFSITSAPGFNPSAPPSPSNNPAPMPLRWLYVLEDSSIVAPSPSGTTLSIPGATRDNPVVGRIAFWADDESAKVNVNTASEGTYWDVPRTYSLEDVGRFTGSFSSTDPQVGVPGYAICQPAQKEFQRYPGHPATTSLSPIFGRLLPVPETISAASFQQEAELFDPYYRFAPRTHPGGSAAGTRVSTSRLDISTDRLFASVHELALDPARRPWPYFSPDDVLRRNFFLTSASVAPELTLFGTPRVAMWPVHRDPARRTTFDALAAFCSTIAGDPYYITRANARSGTQDLSPRNLALYRYLQALTSQDIPGFGGNFLSKYGAGPSGISDRDQLLTCIVDYIRCTNLQDRSQGATPFTPLFSGPGTSALSGDVVPLKIGATQGFGSYYSISEVCVQFFGTFEDGNNTARAERMRAVVFVQPASPLHGMACHRNGAKYRIRGLENFKVDFGSGEVSLNLPSDGTNFIDRSDLASWHGRSVGGAEGPNQGLSDKTYQDSDSGAAARGKYPFYSAADIVIPGSASNSFQFKGGGGEIVVEVLAADTNELIQTLRLEFPDGEFRIPRVVGAPAGVETIHHYRSRNFPGWPWGVYPEDTVVGLQVAGALAGGADAEGPDPTAGDFRMIAALRDVPAVRFRAHPGFLTAGSQWGHSLAANTGHRYTGAQFGTLVPVPNYENWRIGRYPDVSPWVGSQVTRTDGGPGDWDSGFGDQKDGPHINKPDEGDTALWDNQGGKNRPPYILGHNQGFASATKEYFSPNRQIPSAMMLGSLPTGIQRMRPWQTLLFHPRPEDPSHPGRATPPDHLMADLFWMPVVEPYAISQPFATAGKVNMNYQIQPFTYIRRDAALRAVMKSTRFLALELPDVSVYKPLDPGNDHTRAPDRRHSIDLDRTLANFDARFAAGDVFRSATQICEMDLFPKGHAGSMAAFWQSKGLTGDNAREKPYTDIYPRLTTRSNVFTVHIVAQSLRKARNTPPDQWDPSQDSVTATRRSSHIIERFIDPRDPSLPDFAQLAASSPSSPLPTLDQHYQFRILSTNSR